MEQEQFKKATLHLRGRLLSYSEYWLGNKADAEDVVQEVYFRLWFMRDELEAVENVEALAMTITKNLSLNQLKKRDRENRELNDRLPSEALSPVLLLEQKDETALLMRLIAGLPALQQSVIRMKHIEGLETEEIADLTGSSPEAVRMNLSRARKRLKDLYLIENK
ncbi:MAG: sigma-70 family RNA polymerase sigma factor [Dysgonamonadaceae bacterium]|jgi:RNA polymerase sigma-70 factor (ECF subfamily)|nr:sigma-70 family RNA polymerase sigma factor [Dysgonamonadaceae bacterium]